MNRGEYNHKNLGRQLILFHGVQIGNITPSDIDAVIEYKDKAWVLIEVKGHGAVLPTGQRLLLERFVNDVSKAGKKACALVVEHNIANPSEDIELEQCVLRCLYYQGQWRTSKERFFAGDVIQKFLN